MLLVEASRKIALLLLKLMLDQREGVAWLYVEEKIVNLSYKCLEWLLQHSARNL